MYIREIHIENIRGFAANEQAVNLDLARPGGGYAGWTVIAGVNGAGKSTFLRAAALSVSSVSTALALNESYAGWVHEGAPSGSATAVVERAEGDEFLVQGRTLEQPFWTGLEWRQNPAQEPSIEPLIDLNPRGRRKAPQRGPSAENPTGWFIAGYGPFRRLTGHASDAQRLMLGPHRVSRLVSLFREDASLVECVQWLKDLDYRSKEKRPGAEELKQSVLHLLNDGLLPFDTRVERVDSDGLWVNRSNLSLPLTQLSDGYRTMAALVIDIARQLYDAFSELRVEKREGRWIVPHCGVVLIDEVDSHLHVSWQQKIGFWLKEHFPGIQFLVTTHSPFICQAADPGGLIRLSPPGEQSSARHITGNFFNTIVNGSVDEAAMTELFGLEHTYSPHSDEVRQQVSELEAQVILGRAGSAEKEQLEKLSALLPSTETTEVDRSLRKLAGVL